MVPGTMPTINNGGGVFLLFVIMVLVIVAIDMLGGRRG